MEVRLNIILVNEKSITGENEDQEELLLEMTTVLTNLPCLLKAYTQETHTRVFTAILFITNRQTKILEPAQMAIREE